MIEFETADMKLRLECIRNAGQWEGRDSVREARKIYEFVTGASEATPMGRIVAALAAAGVK